MMDAREVISRALHDGRGGAFSLEGFYPEADAILAALKAAGLAIVPVEATEEHVMRVFPLLKGKTWAKSFYPADIKVIYRASIAAAKDQTDGR